MYKNIFDKIIYLAVLIVSPFFLVFILLYRKKNIVRIWGLTSSRIGHFAGNTEMHICSKVDNKKKFLDICYFKNKEICNKFLEKKWREKLKIFPRQIVYPLYKLIEVLSYYFLIFKDHIVFDLSLHSRDYNNYIDKYEPNITFNEDEINKGKSLLKKFGLGENDKFICFIVRDKKYLKHNFPEVDFSKWNYRDYNIDDFIPAAEELTKLGYFVFRMGKISEKRLNTNNNMIIDYSFSDLKSDFLDIFLGANCEFCLSTDVGYDHIPYIFRRPLASITDPISLMKLSSKKFLNIFSLYYSKTEKKYLTLNQIFNSNLAYFNSSQDLYDAKIKIINPGPNEIKNFVIEMVNYIKNDFKLNKVDENLNKKFFEVYDHKIRSENFVNFFQSKANTKIKKLHGEYYGKISPSFLNRLIL
tara:strand:+ start:33404 stop:34645 length:1242 start_codon:yes stop_codon:yes gene_type:complete